MNVLENIDIDMGISQNIDMDEILYRFENGISSKATDSSDLGTTEKMVQFVDKL